jgi:class 3 adenylate cyclase
VPISDIPSPTRDVLSLDLKREIEWFRGNPIQLDEAPLALFDGPARAIRCACAIAERASWLGLTVAAGLHTGECDCSGTIASGIAVGVAEKIVKHAAPGEILVSSTVCDLVAGSGIQLGPRGPLELGEFPGTIQLFEVRRASRFAAGNLR